VKQVEDILKAIYNFYAHSPKRKTRLAAAALSSLQERQAAQSLERLEQEMTNCIEEGIFSFINYS